MSTRPLELIVRPVMGFLSVYVRFYSKHQHLAYSAQLTNLETDQFVASLAKACGYETSGVSYKKDPPLLVWDHNNGSRKLIVSGHVYSKQARTRSPRGVMFRVKISKNQAMDLLREIADPLGWELTEDE